MTDTCSAKHNCLTSSTRTIIFQRENLNYLISLYHLVYLVFSVPLFSIANMFAVRYLWKTYVTKHRDKVTTDRGMSIKITCLQNKIVLQGSHVV